MANLIYGKNSVHERIKQQLPIEMLYVTGAKGETVFLAKKYHVAYQLISPSQANKMVKGNHQGVIAKIDEFKTVTLNQLIAKLDMSQNPILVLCDQLSDPHNLGAILRTCDASGVAAVIIGKNRSVSLTATVAKVASGALETVKVCQVTNLVDAIKQLKKIGFWIVGADNNESIDYRKLPSDRPLVIIVGSEGKGISKLVKEQCDYLVKIFMLGKIDSLNVSVATAVILYDLVGKRIPID